MQYVSTTLATRHPARETPYPQNTAGAVMAEPIKFQVYTDYV